MALGEENNEERFADRLHHPLCAARDRPLGVGAVALLEASGRVGLDARNCV